MASPVHDDLDWRCHRHPTREAGVRCRRCERPLCPDCMITAPVGFQCRDCVRGAPAVRTARSLRVDPWLTFVLLAANVALSFPGLASGRADPDLALFGPAVAAGEWWRIVTSGFVHHGLVHLAFNMLWLWQLGSLLEPVLGRIRFGALYAAGLLAGSLGVVVVQPDAFTAGASGAVFGLMGAAVVGLRNRLPESTRSMLFGLLAINLLLTFAMPGISVGGHLGGLAGGTLASLVLGVTAGSRLGRVLGTVVVVAGSLAAGAGALWFAEYPL